MTDAQPPRRTGAAADAAPPGAAVVRVGTPRSSPRLAAAMWLVAAFVVVAVLKPWGGGGPIAATLQPDAAMSFDITPAPTKDRTATGLAADVCLGAGAWRIATLETWQGRDVRVWRAIEPAMSAMGPLDPLIPAVPVVADALTGLGWCAPAFGEAQPVGPANVRAWQVVGGVARPITLRQVQPEDGITPIAALYVPVSGAWTSGIVVFQYTDAGTGWSGWLGAELKISAAAVPAASRTPPASASPAR